jgi:hypothetical protein
MKQDKSKGLAANEEPCPTCGGMGTLISAPIPTSKKPKAAPKPGRKLQTQSIVCETCKGTGKIKKGKSKWAKPEPT